jgi:DNA-binding transcriptional LysR family regulator
MNPANLSWDHCRSLLGVVREGSLSGAARALGLTQPTVARHIEQLEAALGGIALFTRSPQGLAPTEAAEKLLPHAQSMESAAAALVRAASGSADEISGIVRITASEVIGVEVLPPILRDLREAHPGLVFELTPSNEAADLLRRDADIAVRMTRPRQSALVARKVGDIMLGLHAHRAYLEKYGTPRGIEDLAEHAIIGFDRVTAPVQSVIQALRSMGMDLRREAFAFRSDNDHAQMAALRAGYGIGICQVGLAKRDANLVRLFPNLIAFPLETWITMHGDLRGDPRMRVVFDHLADAIGAYAADRP